MKKLLSIILTLVVSLGLLTGCMPQGPVTSDTSLKGYVAMGNAQIFGDGTASILPQTEEEEAFAALPDSVTSEDGSLTVEKKGVYNGITTVALYLHGYQRLPMNYLTKEEAREEGWEGGSVEAIVGENAAIGGDEFGNYEGLLPGGDAVQYYECDINTIGKDERGAERLVFSGPDDIYYTPDHYKSFEPVYVDGEYVYEG